MRHTGRCALSPVFTGASPVATVSSDPRKGLQALEGILGLLLTPVILIVTIVSTVVVIVQCSQVGSLQESGTSYPITVCGWLYLVYILFRGDRQ